MEHGRSTATMNDDQISDYLIQNKHDRNFINVSTDIECGQ